MHMPAEQIATQIHRQIYTQYTLLHTFLVRPGRSIPAAYQWQTVRLFLTIDLDPSLFKVWFHSGKYEPGPAEGSRLGQGGTPYSEASYLCVTLGIIPQHSFQLLRCLEPLPWVFSNSPWTGAFQLGPEPGWSPRAEKCSEGFRHRGAQCERWWRRRGCDAHLPLTHAAVTALRFTIWWSTQQPGEDASVTRHQDGTDKPRRKDWPQTNLHWLNSTVSTLQKTHYLLHNDIIYWPSLIHPGWTCTRCKNKYTPKQFFTFTDADVKPIL